MIFVKLQWAREENKVVFGVQNGGQCFGGTNTYDHSKHGESDKCGADGKGAPLANNVYQIMNPIPGIVSLC